MATDPVIAMELKWPGATAPNGDPRAATGDPGSRGQVLWWKKALVAEA